MKKKDWERTGSYIHESRGTEGPRHDPYSYTELDVFFQGKDLLVELHYGLAVWIKVNGEEIPDVFSDGKLHDACVKACGYSPRQLETFLARYNKSKRRRCRKCGCKETDWVDGFPGEALLVCLGCGHILDAEFNESAIV